MTIDTKMLVRHYIEKVWNLADLAALDELTTPAFTYYLGGQPGRNRAGMQQFIEMTRTAFPDWRVQIIDIIVEGKIAAEWEQTDSLGMLQQLGVLPQT